MLATLRALADPSRLRLVELLADARPRSVNELSRRLRIAQPQVSKHLRTLRTAGLVTVEPSGPQRFYRLAPGPLAELDRWLARYRAAWERRLDALAARLDALADPRPTRRRR